MSFVTLAQRYATAIFELSAETDQIADTSSSFEKIANLYAASPELQRVLSNPQVEPDELSAILSALGARLSLGQLATDSLRVIAQRRRLEALPEIARQLKVMADAHAGVLRARITSAVPLAEAYRAELIGELERSTHKKIVAEFHEDPELIAGVLTRIGDHVLDGSVRGRLKIIERQLLQT